MKITILFSPTKANREVFALLYSFPATNAVLPSGVIQFLIQVKALLLTAAKKQAGCCASMIAENNSNCLLIVVGFVGGFPPDFLAAARLFP